MKQNMQCLVCFESISSRKKIQLECGHSLCFSCAHQWITERRPTCPMCRASTAYFSRSTRSKSKSLAFLQNSALDIRAVIQGDVKLCYFINKFFCRPRHLWYRPDMAYIMKPVLEWAQQIVNSENVEHNLSPCEVYAFERFCRLYK